MKKRVEALARLERLHQQMHDLASWRLAALERERNELAESRRQMWAAMGEGVAAYGAPAAAALRRILAVERELAAAEAAYAEQARTRLDHGARAKLADRARESADSRYRDQLRRRELLDLVESSLRNPKSSSA